MMISKNYLINKFSTFFSSVALNFTFVILNSHWDLKHMLKYFDIESTKIACWINGSDFDKKKQSLVFIHGSGSDHSAWSHQYGRLHKKYNIVAVNLPGHGHSGGRRRIRCGKILSLGKKITGYSRFEENCDCRPFVGRGHRASVCHKLSTGNCRNCFGWRRNENAG